MFFYLLVAIAAAIGGALSKNVHLPFLKNDSPLPYPFLGLTFTRKTGSASLWHTLRYLSTLSAGICQTFIPNASI